MAGLLLIITVRRRIIQKKVSALIKEIQFFRKTKGGKEMQRRMRVDLEVGRKAMESDVLETKGRGNFKNRVMKCHGD